jgi:hypothetical protein
MSDATAERNERTKAALREKKETYLNSNGGAGQTPCSTPQAPPASRPTNHVNPGTGKRS